MTLLLGLAGRDEGRDAEGRGVLAADLLADRLAELGVVFLLVALLTGVFKSCSLLDPIVKLSSLMGDTLDLLEVFLEVDLAALGRRAFVLLDGLFLIEAGVVLAFEDLGLGVPLLAFEARFAGVGVCLAILILILFLFLFILLLLFAGNSWFAVKIKIGFPFYVCCVVLCSVK